MKKVIKYIIVVFIAGNAFTACETTELDLRVSPNDLAADQADPNLLLNSIQLAYATNQGVISDRGAELTRIDYMSGTDYFNNYPGDTFDGIWSRTYSSGGNGPGSFVQVGMFTNVDNLILINEQTDVDYSFHIGVGQVLKAHMLFLLADYIGEAAFSQASNPAEFPAPLLDSGQDIYTAAFGLLTEGEGLLASGPPTQGAVDLFYDGDTSKWIRLINTIRLKAYVTTGNVSAFNNLINAGNYISDSEEDFQFQYGSSELQPDTRHPDFALDYTPSGARIYQSNWLMEQMLNNSDPRIRYYFYRQVSATPGADAPPNEEELGCSLEVPPQHYIDGGFTYCSVPNGYWGRSHGNPEGIPPDGFRRATNGVYPAGGRFDDSRFEPVGLAQGGRGAGIEPILLASYVDFWRAEMAMSEGAANAAVGALIRTGLEKSIAKVQSFGALDGSADLSLEPSAADVTTFIDAQVDAFVNAANMTDRMNVISEQYFVTLFGGATEAYNYYRRVGFPTTLLPNWEPNPGPFPRTFLYPQNEVITNPNLSQKLSLTQQVFWDTNPASPTFPAAN